MPNDWQGPNTAGPRAPLTPEQIQKIRDDAQRKRDAAVAVKPTVAETARRWGIGTELAEVILRLQARIEVLEGVAPHLHDMERRG